MTWVPEMTTGHHETNSRWSVHPSRHNPRVNILRTQTWDRETQLIRLLSLRKVLLHGGSSTVRSSHSLLCEASSEIPASLLRLYIFWHKPVLQSTAQHKMVIKQQSIRRAIGIVWFHKSPKKWEQKQDPGAGISTNCLGADSENTFQIQGSLFMSTWTQ